MPNVIKPRRNQQGFSLIEVLVATVILALLLAGLAPMLSASALLRRQQELIAEATNLAQFEIEEVRRSWSALFRSGLDATQSIGGLTPVNMRDRIIPMPRPCELTAVNYTGCTQDPPFAPELPRLTPSPLWPFGGEGSFEVVSPDPSGSGVDDLYLYDPNFEPPTSSKIANFSMSGVRGPTTYHVQVFWGYAPGSSVPKDPYGNPKWFRNEVARVVVRIYLAGDDGGLPVDDEGNPTRLTRPVRPVVSSRAENLLDNRASSNDPDAQLAFSRLAPLVVLTSDIPRVYQ